MNTIKFIRIFLLVLIIIGIGLLVTQKMWVPKVVDMIMKVEDKEKVLITKIGMEKGTFNWCMASGGKDLTPSYNAPKKCVFENRIYEESCVSSDKYFVISQGQGYGVGSNILIKYKSSSSQSISCEYLKDDKDFEIKNDFAEYVMAIENNFLILDSGTGPDPRGLIIYDLNTRKKIYDDSYSKPVSISNNVIEYWTETKKIVTKENCPEYWSLEDGGVWAAIDARVSLNLLTLTKKESVEYRCSARQ